MKVELSVSQAELDYIRESIRQKHEKLMEYLDDRAEDAAGAENPPFAESYVLNPGRVKAMKDAGVWDDPVARSAVIKKYIEHDRKQVTEDLRRQVDANFDEEHKKHVFAWKKVDLKELDKPKKVHWTQTPKGKKILAARKKAKK
jgi:hypothetical protein